MKQSKTAHPPLWLIAISLLLLLLTTDTVSFALPDGDVDGNCKVTAADSLLVLRSFVGLAPVTPQMLSHGDVAPLGVDGRPAPDGVLSISDALIILNKSVGLASWFIPPPAITSQPPLSGITGTAYRYQVTSSLGQDSLARYALDTAPAGMSIDSITGLTTWTPQGIQTGSHQIKITATISNTSCYNARQSFTVQITANPTANQPPVANAGSTRTITLAAGQTTASVTLSGSGTDSDGTIASYAWSGTPKPSDVQNPTLSLAAGTYTFTLIVTDNQGAQSAPATVTVTVNPAQPPANVPPTASAGQNQTITLAAGQTTASVTLSGSGTDSDGTIASYAWSGTPKPADVQNPTVTLAAGTYTFTLIVTDNQGAQSAPATVTVTVSPAQPPANVPPTASAGQNQTLTLAAGQTTASVTLSGSGTDSDGSIASYLWSGTPKPADVQNPTLTLAAGTYTFTLIVSDNQGAQSAPATVTVTVNPAQPPANVPPTANAGSNQNITLAAGQSSTVVTLHGSGSDPDGTVASYAWSGTPKPADVQNPTVTLAAGAYTFTLIVTDNQGAQSSPATLTVTVSPAVNQPPTASAGQNQTLTLAAGQTSTVVTLSGSGTDSDGTIASYAWSGSPKPADVQNPTVTLAAGTYTFTLIVTDNQGAQSAPATVTVTVNPSGNLPPVASAGQNQTLTLTAGQTSTVVALSGSGSDPDGTIASYAWSGSPKPDNVQNPTVTLAAGTYTFTLVVADDKGAQSSPSTVIVTVNTPDNLSPVLDPIGAKTVAEGQLLSFTVSGSDPDGTVPVFTTGPLPTGAAFDAATRRFSWTPGYDQAGSYPVQFTVSDGAATASETVTITVTNSNRPPQLQPIGGKSVSEAQTLSFTVSGSDPDGDPLTYSASLPLPAGAAFDAATRTFSWSPGYGQAGGYQVTIALSDGSLSASEIVTITVNKSNRKPLFDPVPPKTLAENALLTFTLAASDPDGDNLTFSSPNLPTGATLTPASGIFAWTPSSTQAGAYKLTFTVSDGTDSALQVADITVTDVNRKPAITTITLAAPRIDTPYAGIVVAADPDNDPLTFALGSGAPSGMTIAASGALVWTPAITEIGKSYTFTVTVDDGKGGSDRREFTLAILDTVSPAVVLNAPKEAIPGATFSVAATATDNIAVTTLGIDTGTVTCASLANCQSSITISQIQAPGSVVTINATAGDAAGNSATATATVKIAAAPDVLPPSILLSAPQTVAAGQSITLAATASDNQGVANIAFAADAAEIGSVTPPANSRVYAVPSGALVGSEIGFSAIATDFSGLTATATAKSTVVDTPDTTPPVITLTLPPTVVSGRTLPVALKVTDDRGVASVDLLLAHQRVSSFPAAVDQIINLPVPAGTQAGTRLVVDVVAVDAAGNTSSASAVSVVELLQGLLTGAVYDDSTGMPLSGATVTLVISGRPDLSAATDARGRYTIVNDEGSGLLTVVKNGYSRVERPTTAVVVNSGRRVIDVRLTPLAPASAAVSAILGGSVTASFTASGGGLTSAVPADTVPQGSASLTVPAGALPADTILSFTQVGAQGLQGRLAIGWSPAAAIDLAPRGLAFGQPATVTLPNLLRLPAGGSYPLVRWDETLGSWIGAGSATIAPDAVNMSALLKSSGQFAVLVPDAGSQLAVPAEGAPLAGLPPLAIDQAATALVLPQPKILFYKPGVTSEVSYKLASQSSLPSGTPILANIDENYSFYSGQKLVGEPFFQDIFLYSFGSQGRALTADHFVSPTLDLAGLALEKGIITVTAAAPLADSAVVTVVGVAGGDFSASGGETITVPVGAVSSFAPLTLKSVPNLTDTGITLPGGYSFVGGLTLALGGQEFSLPALLSLPLPAGFSPAGDLALVSTHEVNGETRLVYLGAAAVENGRVVTKIDLLGNGSVKGPGIVAGGRYFIIDSGRQFGFAGGIVTGIDGLFFAGALVSADAQPLTALSAKSGRYVIPVVAGPFILTAIDPIKHDQGSFAGAGTIKAFTPVDLSLKVEPPTVVATLPAAGAITVPLADPARITFSEPIDPASLSVLNFSLSAAGGGVPCSLELSAGNTVVTMRHADPLAPATMYTLTVQNVKDLAGYAMSGAFSSSFTSLDTNPPPAPPAANISASIPGSDGKTTITATQGTAGLHDTVFIINLTTGVRTQVQVDPNGGFTVTIDAGVKDRLLLEITAPGGGKTTVPLPRFQQKNPDGSITAIFDDEGGRLTVGTTFIDVPQGAFPVGTTLKVKAIAKEDMGLPAPADFPFVAGLEISTSDEPKKYINISAPVPPGTQSDETGVVAEVIDAFGSPAYAMVDTAKIIDGRLATSSPPCPGIVPKPGIITPDGIQDRVNRYALMLNKDQKMRYQRVLTTVYPPSYTKNRLVVQTYLIPLGSTGLPMPMFNFLLEVNTTPSSAFNTLCIVLPPDQQAAFVFRDARSGAVVKTIPTTTPSGTGTGSTMAITYVDTSDTVPPFIVEHRPSNNQLSIITRSIELRFSEAIQDKNIADAIKLLDPANSNAEVEIDIKLSENNSLATITPKQLLGMGKRYRLTFINLKDLAGNSSNLPFMDFYSYAPKMIFPSLTARLDRAKIAADLGIPITSLSQVSLSDLDFSTTPAEKSSDGKWHTDVIGLVNWWGSGIGYRAFTFDFSDPTKPKTLAGYAGNSKYLQKVQYLKNVSLIPRDVPATEAWRGRDLHYLLADPAKRLCVDPSAPASVAALTKWQTENNCSTSASFCAVKTGGCGDLAIVTGYDSVYSQLWAYDVTNLSAPNWYLGMRLLSDNGQQSGLPRQFHTPAGFGMAKRFSLLSPLDITHLGLTHSNAFGAYVAVPGIGLELVDVGLNSPNIIEFERVPAEPLVMSERLTTNMGGLYYQDVQVVRGKVVAIAGDRTDGTGIASIETFGTDLSGPKSMLALGNIPYRMTSVEGFLSYDSNADGVAEPHDVAFVTGADGGLSVVEIPDSASAAMELLAFMKTPAMTVTRHIEVDPVDKVAYIGATFPEDGIIKQGFLVVDVSRLGASVTPVIDADGWDTRIFGRIPVATFASGNVNIKGFRIDKQRGLLFVGIDGSSDSDALVIFKIGDCADLGVDFSEGAPRLPLPLEVEKRALIKGIGAGLKAAAVCGPSSLSGISMIEQGSGACIWKNTCKGNYQPGISDHDYEVFFPGSTSDATRKCVVDRITEQFTELATNEPVELEQDGYKIRFDDISFFQMSKEEFEVGELNVMPPTSTTGDVTGDMGLGRQMLLLKWLLEGAYVEIPGYNLTGRDFASILSLIKRANPALPPNPVLDEPSRIKRLEGYEWAKLQEAEFYGTGALIRFIDEAKPGTTLQHILEKQLHKVAKAGIRGVLARMVADTEANRFVLTNANGNVHERLECLAVPTASYTDWTPEPCDSFEHFVASVAAKSVRDARMKLFTDTDIVDLVYPLYRMKAGKEHLTKEDDVNRFISRAARFLTGLADASGPVKKVFDDTVTSDRKGAQRSTNVDKADARGKAYIAGGKKQIIPRLYNKGGRGSSEFAVRMFDSGEKAKEQLTLTAAEIKHLDVKKVPDPADPAKTITKKIFSITGIDQKSTSAGNRWVDFLVDLPEKRNEEPERKNNWGKLFYYILDPFGTAIPPTASTPVLPIPDPDGTLLNPDNVCVATTSGLRVEQLVKGVPAEIAIVYIGGPCAKVDFVVTNTSRETITNVQIYSSIAKDTFTTPSIPAGGTKIFSYCYPPLTTVGSVPSLVIPTADDSSGKPLPLPVSVDTVMMETHCPIVIESLDPDPNPDTSEIMVGGTFYRYYQLYDYSKSPVEPIKAANITAEFIGSSYVSKNYTTDDKGYIVEPVTPATGPEIGMAVPWSLWGISTLASSQPIQATIKAPGTCAEPVKFTAQLKMLEFEESLKAGAKIDLAATAAVGLGLGMSGGIEMGWKGTYDGATDAYNTFSLGRNVALSGSALAKAEAKMKVKVFDMASVSAQGPSAEASLKFTLSAGDKFEYALPMSDDDKLRFIGLTLNTLLETGSPLAGPYNPMITFVSRYINDYFTDFNGAKSSQSVSGASELSSGLSLGQVGLRFGNRYGIGKGLTFNLGLSGSAKVGFAATIEEMLKERKKVNTGELSYDADLTLALDLKTTTLESEAKATPDAFDPNLLDFTDVWKEVAALKKLGTVKYGFSPGIKFRVVQNPDENMRPEQLEITYKGKGSGGVQILGNQIYDLGPGFKMNRTYSVSKTTEIYRVLNRMSSFSLLMDASAWSYLKANPNLDWYVGPSQAAEMVAEFVALVIGNSDYTENIEKVQKSEIPLGIEGGLGATIKAEFALEAEYSHSYAKEKGRLYAGRSMKLEDYRTVDHVPDTMANTAGRIIGYYSKVKDIAKFMYRNSVKDSAAKQVKSAGSSTLQLANDPDFNAVQGLAAFDFKPLSGPVELARYAPDAVTAAAGKPHYGIGGFEQFVPVQGHDGTLSAPAQLTIHYHPEEVVGIDRDTLALYRFNAAQQDWELLSGTIHDQVAGTLSLPVNSLGLYTLAPPMPSGKIVWQVISLERINPESPGETTRLKVVAGPFTQNNGTPVSAGTRFHLQSLSPNTLDPDSPMFGRVLTVDADQSLPGIQVDTDANGLLHFEAEYPKGSSVVQLEGFADIGTTFGSQLISLVAP